MSIARASQEIGTPLGVRCFMTYNLRVHVAPNGAKRKLGRTIGYKHVTPSE